MYDCWLRTVADCVRLPIAYDYWLPIVYECVWFTNRVYPLLLQLNWPFWRVTTHSDLAALHHALDLGYLWSHRPRYLTSTKRLWYLLTTATIMLDNRYCHGIVTAQGRKRSVLRHTLISWRQRFISSSSTAESTIYFVKKIYGGISTSHILLFLLLLRAHSDHSESLYQCKSSWVKRVGAATKRH